MSGDRRTSLVKPVTDSLPDDECGSIPDTECGSSPDTNCGSLPDTECVSLPDAECGSLPDTECGRLPDTECGSLPDTERGSLPDTECGSSPDAFMVLKSSISVQFGRMDQAPTSICPPVRGSKPNARLVTAKKASPLRVDDGVPQRTFCLTITENFK